MYVDESGDPGLWAPGTPVHLRPSPHYILTGVIIPAPLWQTCLTVMVDVKRTLRQSYGLRVRDELHGAELIHPRGNQAYKRIGGRKRRVSLYTYVLREVAAQMPQTKIVNVHLNKANPYYASSTAPGADPEERAWEWLIQRFSNHLTRDCDGDLGMILADETNEIKVRRVVRKIRVHNQVGSMYGGSYSVSVRNIVEDPVMRNSQHSYFVQIADLVSHALYRQLYPKGSYRKYNIDRLFDLVDPLLLKAANRKDPQGIVHL
jgi:hypothetical protein